MLSKKRARFQKSELAFVKSVLTNHSMAYMFSGSQKASSFVKHLKKGARFFEKLASFLHTVVNEKASSLWKLARFLVKWSPGHNMSPTFSPLTSLSFHVNRAFHSWIMNFSKFDLEYQGSRSWVRSQFKVTIWVWNLIDSYPFCSMAIGHPIPELWLFQRSRSWVRSQFKVTMWV